MNDSARVSRWKVASRAARSWSSPVMFTFVSPAFQLRGGGSQSDQGQPGPWRQGTTSTEGIVRNSTVIRAGLATTLVGGAGFALLSTPAAADNGFHLIGVPSANARVGVQNNVLTP